MVKRGLSTFPSPLAFGQAVGDKAALWVRAAGEEVTGLELSKWRPGLLPQVRDSVRASGSQNSLGICDQQVPAEVESQACSGPHLHSSQRGLQDRAQLGSYRRAGGQEIHVDPAAPHPLSQAIPPSSEHSPMFSSRLKHTVLCFKDMEVDEPCPLFICSGETEGGDHDSVLKCSVFSAISLLHGQQGQL